MTNETRRALGFAVDFVIFVVMLIGIVWGSAKWIPAWKAGGGAPVPREFQYLLFPASVPNQDLLDSAGQP